MEKTKEQKRKIRRKRVYSKVMGIKVKPRISVFRSNKHIYVQLIDDIAKKTLLSVSDFDLVEKKKADKFVKVVKNDNLKKVDVSFLIGEELAKKALKMKLEKAVFDKSGYRYHGRVKAVAEGARKGGLKF